ncbi:PREDICTED: uncharacterized protein LOC108616757 [Drosophila arizonae]|uniref:Uncharacterized protein LOC108616757 n=1 Tax=Drosophila arizonae TaxID=7263 RepID=A0ABM1PKD1_DROAR|nr:PREDICTED: uncharacterized protein LOC108616757 [Drosophila arizonae]
MNMSTRLRDVLAATFVVICLCHSCAGKRNWDYEPISVHFVTSDASKINVISEVVRVSRYEYAISGNLTVTEDLDETTMIEAICYRSKSGAEDDYSILPFSIPNQPLEDFTKSYYKDILYKSLKHCSNVPPPEEAYPWPKGVVTFDMCSATGEGLPEYLPEGYYKIIFNLRGGVEIAYTGIVKLTTKLF